MVLSMGGFLSPGELILPISCLSHLFERASVALNPPTSRGHGTCLSVRNWRCGTELCGGKIWRTGIGKLLFCYWLGLGNLWCRLPYGFTTALKHLRWGAVTGLWYRPQAAHRSLPQRNVLSVERQPGVVGSWPQGWICSLWRRKERGYVSGRSYSRFPKALSAQSVSRGGFSGQWWWIQPVRMRCFVGLLRTVRCMRGSALNCIRPET